MGNTYKEIEIKQIIAINIIGVVVVVVMIMMMMGMLLNLYILLHFSCKTSLIENDKWISVSIFTTKKKLCIGIFEFFFWVNFGQRLWIRCTGKRPLDFWKHYFLPFKINANHRITVKNNSPEKFIWKLQIVLKNLLKKQKKKRKLKQILKNSLANFFLSRAWQGQNHTNLIKK